MKIIKLILKILPKIKQYISRLKSIFSFIQKHFEVIYSTTILIICLIGLFLIIKHHNYMTQLAEQRYIQKEAQIQTETVYEKYKANDKHIKESGENAVNNIPSDLDGLVDMANAIISGSENNRQ